MNIQYKPTKQKKEKPVRAPKAPKAEKPVKFNSSMQAVKTSKPAKAPNQPRSPKAEKSLQFTPTVKMGKVEKVEKSEKNSALRKPINPKVAVAIILSLIVIAAVAIVVGIPAANKYGEEISHIFISSTPIKTIYLLGEEANYDGLRVVVARNNGETFTVRANKCQITGFDSSAPAQNQVITVSYEGFTASFSISVEEPPKPTPALIGISLKVLPKTEYKLGEWLDTSGGVLLREYVDGTTAEITLVNSYVSGFADIDAPGEYTLTVNYIENGIICETTYTITVTE